jgi:hypothetical protein
MLAIIYGKTINDRIMSLSWCSATLPLPLVPGGG